MKRTRLSLIIAAAALALALGSCTEGPVGIFASVAAETDINKWATDEFKGTSPNFVAKAGSTYYAGVGGLWKRNIGDSSWTTVNVSLPSLGTGNYAAVSGITIGSTMYVLFADADTKAKLGIYSSTNGSTWTEVDVATAVITKNELSHLMTDGNDLFAVTAQVTETDGEKITKHSVYRSIGGAAFAALDGTSLVNADIGLPTSIVNDGGTYYLSAGEYIVTGTAGSMTVTNPATTSAFGSAVIVNGLVFFTGRDGKIYNDDASVASGVFSDYNDRDYSFGIPVVVSTGNPTTQTTLLVPSRAYPQGSERDQGLGYLEFDATGFGTTSAAIADTSRRVSTLNNYFITLDGKSVKQFIVFTEGDARRLYALTDGDGLWMNFFDGGTPGSWTGWRRE